MEVPKEHRIVSKMAAVSKVGSQDHPEFLDGLVIPEQHHNGFTRGRRSIFGGSI